MDGYIALDELRDWLALYTTPHCGLSTVVKLLRTFSTPSEILLASDEELLNAGANRALIDHLHQPDWECVELCLRWLDKPDRYILHWGDSRYPLLLREISAPPLILFAVGEPLILQQRQLAVVGARCPTPTGLEIAYQFAHELSEQGFVITSGLARGIDAAAHKGAMAGLGKTVAVLGSGIDNVYPVYHQSLAEKILEKGGVLLSEFFPNAPPRAEHFPRRNRIISGLTLGVLVIEAALRSGSLITARYAVEQGREVFAVPGSIRNRLSQGCHALLKEGATLIEHCEDVMQGLFFLPEQQLGNLLVASKTPSVKASEPAFLANQRKQNQQKQKMVCHNKKYHDARLSERAARTSNPWQLDVSILDSQDIKLVECLGFETTSIDTLVARTGLGVDKLLARLLLLELQGYISVLPGGYARK